MKTIITIFCLLFSYSVFGQNQEALLMKAFFGKSDTFLIKFFNNWQKEIPKNDVNVLNDTLKIINKIIGDIYLNKENNLHYNDKYIIIDSRKISIEIAKEDTMVKNFINRIENLDKYLNNKHNQDSVNLLLNFHFKYKISQSQVLENFAPSYGNDKVLYLNDKYNKMFWDFLVIYDKYPDREEFLRKNISNFFVDGRRFSTHEVITSITLFISMNLAIVNWSTGYCSGSKLYRLNNNTWNIFHHIYTICE